MRQFQILIIDLGSQYALLIGRTLRELGFQSITLSPKKADAWLKTNRPKAIILSGGNASVHDTDCPEVPEGIFTSGIPLLCICLGMQIAAQKLGGSVTGAVLHSKEYGGVFIETIECSLFQGIDQRTLVWASHGDCVEAMPQGFRLIARSEDHDTMQGMANADDSIVCIQFHPEVQDTPDGKRMFLNFLHRAECTRDWDSVDVVTSIRNELREAVVIPDGKGNEAVAKAIIGLSGGVDSSVAAKLLFPIMGDQLLGITIDTGFLRKGELAEISRTAASIGITHRVIRAADQFEAAIKDTIDAEEKRKRFKEVYQKVLETEAKNFGANFIVQGSLATDFIESGKAGGSALIKSHHNIGIDWKLNELHPLRNFFKYEVREIGDAIGLPYEVTHRQPFPGPGLMVRVIGTPAVKKVVSTLRTCDAWVRDILENHGIYEQISQLVVALDGTKTVGIKGDGRSYGYGIIIRPVVTQDFMTCTVYHLPVEIQQELMRKLTQHPCITRVFMDITTKPPATTEME